MQLCQPLSLALHHSSEPRKHSLTTSEPFFYGHGLAPVCRAFFRIFFIATICMTAYNNLLVKKIKKKSHFGGIINGISAEMLLPLFLFFLFGPSCIWLLAFFWRPLSVCSCSSFFSFYPLWCHIYLPIFICIYLISFAPWPLFAVFCLSTGPGYAA